MGDRSWLYPQPAAAPFSYPTDGNFQSLNFGGQSMAPMAEAPVMSFGQGGVAAPSWTNSNTAQPGVMGRMGEWFGKNGNMIAGGLQGLGSIYSAYNASKQLGLMKDNLKFQKDSFNTNLTNQIQSYNTSLTDKINGRTSNYAGKEADVAAYLAANSLKTPPTKKK